MGTRQLDCKKSTLQTALRALAAEKVRTIFLAETVVADQQSHRKFPGGSCRYTLELADTVMQLTPSATLDLFRRRLPVGFAGACRFV